MIVYFEGPAGTGKTYNIIAELKRRIVEKPLEEWQKVLALTFMHGSRIRLNEKLTSVEGLRGKYISRTIDSFAWNIARRWKTLINSYGFDLQEQNYEKTCEAAAKILTTDQVLTWVTSVYPVIIVDEMQDCKSHRLEIIKNLSRGSYLIAAADEFQDLNCDGDCKNIEWLNTSTSKTSLSVIHRTNVKALVDTANLIRNGGDIRNVRGISIISSQSHAMAGSKILYDIPGLQSRDVAIISPVGISNSKFIRDIDEWLKKTSLYDGRKKPQLFINWEKSENEYLKNAEELLDKVSEKLISIDYIRSLQKFYGVENLYEWMDKQRKLSGIRAFKKDTLLAELQKIIHQNKSYSFVKPNTVRGLVIHQAKNREFDYVYVLWPYEVSQKDKDKLRRLLYNAVTRAKINATIILQDPKGIRRNSAPFC